RNIDPRGAGYDQFKTDVTKLLTKSFPTISELQKEASDSNIYPIYFETEPVVIEYNENDEQIIREPREDDE
ncbi:MAG: hypothetical protein ABEI86_11730, partial [Halobacteriaceae archaeon]